MAQTSSDPMDRTLVRSMIMHLLNGWEGALHNVDTLFQIANEDPDYLNKASYWTNDPHRIQTTQERFRPARELFLAIVDGEEVDGSRLQQALKALNPKVH